MLIPAIFCLELIAQTIIVASGGLNDPALSAAGLVRFFGCVESLDGTIVFARGDVTVLEYRPPPPAATTLLA